MYILYILVRYQIYTQMRLIHFTSTCIPYVFSAFRRRLRFSRSEAIFQHLWQKCASGKCLNSLGRVLRNLRFGSVQHLDLFLRLTNDVEIDGPEQTHWNYRNRPGVFMTQHCIWFLGFFLSSSSTIPLPLFSTIFFPCAQIHPGWGSANVSGIREAGGNRGRF